MTISQVGSSWRTVVKMLVPVLAAFCLYQNASGRDIGKVLVIGDSITKHAPAVEKLGWTGDWGMAASSEDKDYVHLFIHRLAEAQGKAPELTVSGEGGGRLKGRLAFLQEFQQAGADLAIVQMGENDNTDVTEAGFQKPYEQILSALRAGNTSAKIYCFGVWAQPKGDAVKDAMIRAACQKYGAIFVDLKLANADQANRAGSEKRFTNAGVNWHPGDRGMAAYADALWAAYTGINSADKIVESKNSQSDWAQTEDWNGGSDLRWVPRLPIEEHDGRDVAVFSQSKDGGSVAYKASLPIEMIKGRMIFIEAKLKSQDLSEKLDKWNGIKLMIKWTDAEGKLHYPQAPIPIDTVEWTEIKWSIALPENAVSAEFVVGLERVTGTVWMDQIKLAVGGSK